MNSKIILRICGIISGFSGLVILFSSFYPIIAYEWESNLKYPILLNPLVSEKASETPDLTKASNWFEGGAAPDEFVSGNITFFTLSVPKLKIDNARVSIGGEDLSDSLIQYPGTALPGKIGNSVIFGHSILPIFYDPTSYLAIFSTLDRLKKGDEIYTNYDGVMYRYKVENLFEVKPTDLQILEQDKSDSFLTLVTCSPPGDPRRLKRLIVRARLQPAREANANIRN